MIGFIKLHRKLLEWEWYDDIPVRLTFFHLLLTANYKDKEWRGITIKRGQVLTGSIETPKNIGISRQQFRRAIKSLKSTNEITTKTTNKNTLVTLINYDKYQEKGDKTTTKTTNSATIKQPSNNHQTTTTKEVKNIRSKEYKKREAQFKKLLSPFLEKYGSEMLNNFFKYWTEKNPRGWKMKFEKQKTFDISKRLEVWARNDKKWKPQEKKTGAEAFKDLVNG